MAIDIGAEAIDRGASWSTYTQIDKDNPANATGTITTVYIWCAANLVGCKVGIFYKTNGDTLKCRSAVTIGAVAAGAMRTFGGLSLAVVAGDYIGMFYTEGGVELDTSGFAGLWYGALNVDHVIVDDETTYSQLANFAISLKGIGTEAGPAVVEGSASGSGIGLASSSAKLDVLASALGNGIGLAQSSSFLEVFAQASGQGIGLSEATAYLIILASASGEGIGLGVATGEVIVIAVYGIGAGSGIGTATAQGILDVIASAEGNGVGEATTQAILDILAEAGGSGVGLGSTEALIKVLAAAAASGEGLGSAEALLEVMAEALGSGIGLGVAEGSILIIIAIFSSEAGIGIERASRYGWLMEPAVYTKDAFDVKVYTGE